MLTKIIQQLQRLKRSTTAPDLSRFDDPVARQTEWTPAKGGGTNFLTHSLVQVHSNRIEFRSSAGAQLFAAIFFMAGTAISVFGGYQLYQNGISFTVEIMLPLLVGGIFAVAGGWIYRSFTAPIVFDTRQGYFWKGRTAPRHVANLDAIKELAEIGEIHALQIISEHCSGKNSSYYSYELNLVLRDSRRINVVDHGNAGRLREDCEKLSRFLGVPVWDATR